MLVIPAIMTYFKLMNEWNTKVTTLAILWINAIDIFAMSGVHGFIYLGYIFEYPFSGSSGCMSLQHFSLVCSTIWSNWSLHLTNNMLQASSRPQVFLTNDNLLMVQNVMSAVFTCSAVDDVIKF